MAETAVERMARIKSGQVRNLAQSRERAQNREPPPDIPFEHETAPPSQAVHARSTARPQHEPSLSHTVSSRPPAQVAPLVAQKRPMDAMLADFDELFPIIMDRWECDAEERAQVRGGFCEPDSIVETLDNWMKEVIVYDLPVTSEMRIRCFEVFSGRPVPERAPNITTQITKGTARPARGAEEDFDAINRAIQEDSVAQQSPPEGWDSFDPNPAGTSPAEPPTPPPPRPPSSSRPKP